MQIVENKCFDEISSFMTECDYAEALKAEFDMEIQQEVFRFNHTLSIEGIICEYHNKHRNDVSNDPNVNIDFHSIFQMTLLRIQLLHLNIPNISFNLCMRKICS